MLGKTGQDTPLLNSDALPLSSEVLLSLLGSVLLSSACLAPSPWSCAPPHDASLQHKYTKFVPSAFDLHLACKVLHNFGTPKQNTAGACPTMHAVRLSVYMPKSKPEQSRLDMCLPATHGILFQFCGLRCARICNARHQCRALQ